MPETLSQTLVWFCLHFVYTQFARILNKGMTLALVSLWVFHYPTSVSESAGQTGVCKLVVDQHEGGLSMRDALIFNGASNLDFHEIRSNVVRIPEVVSRIREAQKLWDKISEAPLDLANFIGSEDSIFLGHIKLKSFATAVVQIGLLDRYLKNFSLPEFVIGAINGDSPMKVAMGMMTFADMVCESPAVTNLGSRPLKPTPAGAFDLPILTGVQLVEYAVYRRNALGTFEAVTSNEKDVEKMVVELVDGFELSKMVMVGPGNAIFGRKMNELTSRDIQVLESIDLDPMLSWFWLNLKESRLAVAN